MKNVLKTGLFYLVVFTMVVGNSMLSIDFSTAIAQAEESEKKPEVLAEKITVEPYSNPNPVTAVWGLNNESVIITWAEITDDRLDGYKVVMSETETHPVYDHSGDDYIEWQTNSTITEYVHNYEFVCDQNYYYSVTALYDDKTVFIAGNAVELNFACEVPAECGNGIYEPANGEACDNGLANIDGQLPVYDPIEGQGDRTYCSTSCQLYDVIGLWCGDEIVTTPPEECDGEDNCTAECILIEEPEEECPEEDNLIINYSFEEPVVTNASLWQKMSSVLGWVIERVSDNSATTLEFHKGWSANVAADGLQYAELDGDHSTRITQDVVTEEGAEYKLFWSFAARHNITAEQNHLSVEVNGSQIGTNGPIVGSAPLTQNDWENSNYVFTADSTNTEITLEDIGPSDTYGTFVDNVRLCKIADPEPDPEPAPWCSALMGAFKAYYDPSSSVHGVYNEVIDVYKGDGLFEVINLSDEGLVKTMYHEANDAVCYEQFEDEEGFNFQCEDEEVGWCGGLKQGIADFYGQTYINDDLHPRYDLNNDDVVNLSDSVLLAQLIGTDNQAECYTYYVPPFLMCENPEPICGNGGEPEVGEQCDDGNLINGDGCSSSCQLENTPPPPCSGCGTTFAIRDLKSDISCSAFDISWRTTKNSDTILDLGTESGVYTENINNDTNTGNHSLSIADLLPNTTYYYKVRAISTSGKEIEVSEKSFTTPPTEQCEEVLGEKIIGDPLICDFLRPSGSVGGDLDIDGVFQYPNGSLLRDACVPTMPVYLIKDQQKWHVPTWQYLHDKHFGERIYNVVTTVLDYYPDWTGEVLGVKDYADGTLLRGNDMKVYILDKGEKQHINTLEKLAKYLGQDIINVSDEVLARY
ncbi:MAG: DUF642 domain-containing protein [Candidatus Komeilibacteria bacterium]|nr:DUF642 domain-containing protein [Candidatus Komeilibacteria bacterium]